MRTPSWATPGRKADNAQGPLPSSKKIEEANLGSILEKRGRPTCLSCCFHFPAPARTERSSGGCARVPTRRQTEGASALGIRPFPRRAGRPASGGDPEHPSWPPTPPAQVLGGPAPPQSRKSHALGSQVHRSRTLHPQPPPDAPQAPAPPPPPGPVDPVDPSLSLLSRFTAWGKEVWSLQTPNLPEAAHLPKVAVALLLQRLGGRGQQRVSHAGGAGSQDRLKLCGALA